MVNLALSLVSLGVGNILILIARIVIFGPPEQLTPIFALTRLESVIFLAVWCWWELIPRRVICVAIDILKQGVQAMLNVIKRVFSRDVSTGC